MPFLMSFALEPEIVTLAWIDNAAVQFPLNIYATKGETLGRRVPEEKATPWRAAGRATEMVTMMAEPCGHAAPSSFVRK
jgi:hypothetical protein